MAVSKREYSEHGEHGIWPVACRRQIMKDGRGCRESLERPTTVVHDWAILVPLTPCAILVHSDHSPSPCLRRAAPSGRGGGCHNNMPSSDNVVTLMDDYSALNEEDMGVLVFYFYECYSYSDNYK